MKSFPSKRTVLKLIYHTVVFGPIDLEYDRPVVRVGSSEDNDLVLPHPSIKPHHCLLVFRGEKLLCYPPGQIITPQTDLRRLTGREHGAGDALTIGELNFTLAHSGQTVALPSVHGHSTLDEPAEVEAPVGTAEAGSKPRHYCAYCKAFVPEAQVKRVGLVGHAKRGLCPKCGRLLEMEPQLKNPSPDLNKPTPPKSLSSVIGNYKTRLLGRKDS